MMGAKWIRCSVIEFLDTAAIHAVLLPLLTTVSLGSPFFIRTSAQIIPVYTPANVDSHNAADAA